jgi:hypothetical protein
VLRSRNVTPVLPTRQRSLSLIPYVLAAAYALKLGARGETYDRPRTTTPGDRRNHHLGEV